MARCPRNTIFPTIVRGGVCVGDPPRTSSHPRGGRRASLLDAQGEWLLPHQVDLFPYDAGTEEGTELSLSNPATSPQGMIASLKGTGKFSDQPIARLTFDLQLPVLAALRSCHKEKEHELHRE